MQDSKIENRHSQRHADKLKIPLCRTKNYKNSFFPLSFNFWNNLNSIAKSKITLCSFKSFLKKRDKPKKLFYYGERNIAIIHARIRMGCSGLNSHLCLMLHVINDPSCDCGAEVESPKHYFLHCPRYIGPRIKLLNSLGRYTAVNINILLFGNDELDLRTNKLIFKAVHLYIKESHRFVGVDMAKNM